MCADRNRIGVDIVQPIVPEYRVALFEGLARDAELSVSVQASRSLDNRNVSVPVNDSFYSLDHPVVHFPGTPFVWQKKLRLINVKRRGDVLVVCGNITHLSNYWLIVRARACGAGIIWWGHHRTAFSRSWKVRLRLLVTRLVSDVVLCYTDEGIRYLLANGFKPERVFATGNTINQVPIEEACSFWTVERLNAFRKKQGLIGTKVIVFCSMLRRKTQLDVLIAAMSKDVLKRMNVRLVIIGDGEMRREYEDMATRLGVISRVEWLGIIHDQNAIAPWFLSARAFVYPGAIGLSLLHAFSYGLPVITHGNADHQMPEFEALIPNENGLVFNEGEPNDLASKIAYLLSSDVLFTRLSIGAKKAAQNYSMPRMIDRFKEAVVACSRLKNQQGVNA
jgi:glycosyltransferase involved in cell wall biosynthesis